MSVVTEILDRLTGITTVADRLAETRRNLDQVAQMLFDHEKRLIRLETPAASTGRRTSRALARK